MGGLFSGGSGGQASKPTIIAGGFADDGAKELPTAASAQVTRRIQQQITARSGRTSTNLSQPGTRPYLANYLGNTG